MGTPTYIVIFVCILFFFVVRIVAEKRKKRDSIKEANDNTVRDFGQTSQTRILCDVCGKNAKCFTYRDKDTGEPLYHLCINCNNSYKSAVLGRNITIGEARLPFDIYPDTIDEVKSSINKTAIYRPKEHRMHCNACGNLFCYSAIDLWNNEANRDEARQANNRAIIGALGGNLLSSDNDSAARDRYRDKILDFTRCPKCNSTDLVELSENEYAIQQERNSTTVLSPADEIKKLKELLDSGVITQEEFDAKKKQLLGL